MTTTPPAGTPTSIPPFNRLKQCRYGPMLYNINDAYVGRSFDLYGEFSEGETQLFRQIVQPGDVVFDVGANIGAHTIFLAQAVGVQGAVIAVEPQRIVYQTLCANVALNNLVNVYCHNVACSEAPGTIQVPVLNPAMPHNFGGLEINRNAPGEEVPVIRLDSLPVGRCKLMKVDVEGMELDVLKGATGIIERCRPVLYVENDREPKAAELVKFIASLGYNLYWHRPFLYNPDNFLKNPQNVFSRIVSLNVLCIPKEAKAEIKDFEPVAIPA